MRVLVYPHEMEIGGSQLNAIQLAAAVRDRGHEVIMFSRPGTLSGRVGELGLEHVLMPADRRRPSPATIWQLAQLARERDIDVIHGYEWPPVVDAAFASVSRRRTAVVGTVMSMSVVPFFPRTVPLVVGTEVIRDAAVSAGHQRVVVIEPPVDTSGDRPTIDGSSFRTRHGIDADEMLVVIVCRLVSELKLEGLLAACDAVGQMAQAKDKVRLVIVGDGRERKTVAASAAMANALAGGRPVITLTGEVNDPREAYAAADVVVGQGGSALRGMAFGKPLVVAGEDGFVELLTPQSAPLFLHQGWFGAGPGSRGRGAPALRAFLDELLRRADYRATLGAFARELVVARFSLRHAAEVQEAEYEMAFSLPPLRLAQPADLARCALGVCRSKVSRKYQRLRGTVAVDDANSRPQTANQVPQTGVTSSR